MALKAKIKKAQFDKLSDELKAEYKPSGDSENEYVLDVEGGDDFGELKRAKDREAQKAKDLQIRVTELEGEITELSGNDAKKRGDIKVLETQWKEKVKTVETEAAAKIAKLEGFTKGTLIDGVALALASKISKAPALLLPHIKARLQADLDGDTPATKVLGADGKVSALTIEDLGKEFSANKDFADIIIASKANGGAGPANPRFGGGAPNNQGDKPADLSKLNAKDLAAHIKSTKEANNQQT